MGYKEILIWREAKVKPHMTIFFREVRGAKEHLETGHGTALAVSSFDYVIKDKLGEYPINKQIFHEKYEVLD